MPTSVNSIVHGSVHRRLDTNSNPTVPDAYKDVHHAPVTLGRHVIIGSASVILPGSTLEDGVAVCALSLVKGNCQAFGIYAGNPARRVRERKRDLLDVEKRFLAERGSSR